MIDDDMELLTELLERALAARSGYDAGYSGALRLFNGFYEGYPTLVADLFGTTLALYSYDKEYHQGRDTLQLAQAFYLERIPWLSSVVHKFRYSQDLQDRQGKTVFGDAPVSEIVEHGIHYAIDLQLNQDASFYLDTQGLRRWLLDHAAGWSVLNTFAYTGSLGVAALVGGAVEVIQTDRSKKFLDFARRSTKLNQLDMPRMKLMAGDFFPTIAHLKRTGALFDCVILDPPFFSSTDKGTVNQVEEFIRLINKVRPLVKDGGVLVAINNALFLSGADYEAGLQSLCADGYLTMEGQIQIPEDITGIDETITARPPVDPAPFNHPTKIALLGVRRKDGAR